MNREPNEARERGDRNSEPPNLSGEKKGIDWAKYVAIITATIAVLGAVIGASMGLLAIGEWKGKRESFEETVVSFMTEIRKDIVGIRKDIKEISQRLPRSSVYSGSPLRLTELGQSISKTLDASTWAKKTAKSIIHQVEGKDSYEIQEFCVDFVRRRKYDPSDAFLKELRNCAYNEGIFVEDVEDVLAVELRDALLKISPD